MALQVFRKPSTFVPRIFNAESKKVRRLFGSAFAKWKNSVDE
jgi:hypothetical protein